MENILNRARVDGLYDNQPAFMETEYTVLSVDMSITKTADKPVWISGELTYTVVIQNNEATLPLTGVTFTDILDFTKVNLVTDSVMVNGVVTAYTYNPATGELNVSLPDIPISSSLEVTFRVTKI